jgi:predicted aspartyl protease
MVLLRLLESRMRSLHDVAIFQAWWCSACDVKAMRKIRGVAVLILVCGCLGCTTRSYTVDDAADASELRIRVGDEIRVVTTDRERVSFRVTEVREDRFAGVTLEPAVKETLPADSNVEIPYEKLAMIQVTRFDPKAAAAASGVVVFTVALGTLVVTGVPVIIPPP